MFVRVQKWDQTTMCTSSKASKSISNGLNLFDSSICYDKVLMWTNKNTELTVNRIGGVSSVDLRPQYPPVSGKIFLIEFYSFASGTS